MKYKHKRIEIKIYLMDNPVNKLITRDQITKMLNYFENIGNNGEILELINLQYFQRAFVNETYYQSVQNSIINKLSGPLHVNYINYIPEESSERLEFLGDHVLKTIMGRYLYERFYDEREGFLTKLKIKIEQCTMLHKFGKILGFQEFLLLSLQTENQSILDINRGRYTEAYLEDCFEAFIGAIMIEFGSIDGYIYADRFVRSIIENTVDFAELISQNSNYKDSLQKFFFKDRKILGTPNYININEQGPVYRKIFTIMLTISRDQYISLPSELQTNITRYNESVMGDYKVTNLSVYEKLIKNRLNNYWILGIGCGRKIIQAEQACAKKCMDILELPQDY